MPTYLMLPKLNALFITLMNSKDSLFTLTESEVPCESSCDHVRWGRKGRGFQVVSVNIREFKTLTHLSIIPGLYVSWLISCFLVRKTARLPYLEC